MDPYHITEFASPRYFTKLNQQEHQQPQHGEVIDDSVQAGPSSIPAHPSTARQAPAEESTFILPLRPVASEIEYTPNILKPQENKKRRWPFFRKTSSKPGSSEDNQPPHILHLPYHLRHRSSIADPAVPEDVHTPVPFNELFFSLPTELQTQVIAALPLSDILSLRLASRSWHDLITMNEAPIVRYHLDHHIPTYAKRLYPSPPGSKLTLHYLCGLWHRLHVAAKLSFLICEWITKDIFLRKTDAEKAEFAPKQERMRRRLIPLVFTVFHFFEAYRDLHVAYIEDNGYGLHRTPYTSNPLELRVMEMYDPHTLLRVHEIFPLVVASFCRRLRPPSYVGRVEGALRGYLREKPSDEIYAATLLIGGLRQVERFWEVKGYNLRRAEVDKWYAGITHEPVEAATKRRVFKSLSRKKSFIPSDSSKSMADGAEQNHGPWGPNMINFPLRSSLTDGMPMGPLSRDDIRKLIPDLPALHQIWAVTAEALILDQKIVEKTTDIRRNAQVMLELIREDGWDDEDEWWYGQDTPESVRPKAGVTDDDDI
ncbi:Rik1-associated factor 1 [Zalerion maritima]|uniref:Rik1-associated factor 1 n=1 Tax=Zalerion maritima TaxID=339359 RepID=A0AAD5WWA5_9PEZI|nr:Rik1-associated factor 1 [Zalerion maritima]